MSDPVGQNLFGDTVTIRDLAGLAEVKQRGNGNICNRINGLEGISPLEPLCKRRDASNEPADTITLKLYGAQM